MASRGTRQETGVLPQLNDLLQLDHDAVQAYTRAVDALQNAGHRDTLTRFRVDHERHIVTLSGLIRGRGGDPVQLSSRPDGPFKLAVHAAVGTGGDAAILRTLNEHERRARDQYRRTSRRSHSVDVADALRRGASDEETHYTWLVDALADMGHTGEAPAGAPGEAREGESLAVGGALEVAGRQITGVAESARAGLQQQLDRHPMRTVLLAFGTGVLVGGAFRPTKR